ncbi:energy transducer TonB family protein [Falsirhodobacter xinxiangensis]|uniref:energy transducer TonB family protein n=1 Tax=Falsirhodobacter xinxiangensis TaxID=2530049 RepID=UPI0010AB1D85|nr:TonB family protein [Rhodobacter xinxiangensis]
MKRRLTTCDWHAWLGPDARRREWMGWAGAAISVAAMLAATTAIALQLENREGLKDAAEDAILLDLEASAPAPPALAMSAPAPDVPQVDASEAPELIEEDPTPPEPVAEEEPLPEPEDVAELLEPEPDEIALPDAPPPPPPKVKPRERPERVVERVVEREEPRREPRREAAAPPPQQRQQAAPSQAQGTAQNAVSAGQLQNLEQQWGGAIRNRVERRKRASREVGAVSVRITVTRNGELAGASVQRSSGNPTLDQLAIRTVQSAGRFPAAPDALTKATYSFTLPLEFQRR